MLQKIKDLMQVQETAQQIGKEIASQRDTVAGLTGAVSALQEEIKTIKLGAEKSLHSVRQNLSEIEHLKEELRKEIYDFKLLKNQMQNRVMERLETEIEQELKIKKGSRAKQKQFLYT